MPSRSNRFSARKKKVKKIAKKVQKVEKCQKLAQNGFNFVAPKSHFEDNQPKGAREVLCLRTRC